MADSPNNIRKGKCSANLLLHFISLIQLYMGFICDKEIEITYAQFAGGGGSLFFNTKTPYEIAMRERVRQKLNFYEIFENKAS